MADDALVHQLITFNSDSVLCPGVRSIAYFQTEVQSARVLRLFLRARGYSSPACSVSLMHELCTCGATARR